MGSSVIRQRGQSNEPFNAAPPLDGAGNPSDLAGSPHGGPVTALEIGIIIGVIIAVTLLLVAIFFWRARRNRKVELEKLADRRDMDVEEGNSIPHSWDDQDGCAGNIADTDKILTVERSDRRETTRPLTPNFDRQTWGQWAPGGHSSQRQGGKFYIFLSCIVLITDNFSLSLS